MNLQDLGAIGEFMSALLITVTLIFLVIETRRGKEAMLQNNRVIRQQMRNTIQVTLSTHPALAESMTVAAGHLSPEFQADYEARAAVFGLDASRYRSLVNYLRAEFSHFEDQFFTELPEADRRAVEYQYMGVLRSPVNLEFWRQQRQFFHPDFCHHTDGLIERVKDGLV